MGKNLSKSKLVKRSQKVAFYKVPSENLSEEGKFTRMEGFTKLDYSKNPEEYTRQYVDEDSKRTDIIGYSPSIAYSFDRHSGNTVLDDIVKISENEYIGNDAVREIINVDMTTKTSTEAGTETAKGKIRQYSVSPDSDGDNTNCMVYSGKFNARDVITDCTVTSKDDWQTIETV